MGTKIYMLSEAVDKWRETARRAIQGRDENYRAYQQELRTNRALQARLDEALLNWTEERGLRDGWEQTAGELQAAVDHLRGDRDRLQQRLDTEGRRHRTPGGRGQAARAERPAGQLRQERSMRADGIGEIKAPHRLPC